MRDFLKKQWTKYRRRKTKLGIILDFLFFALLIGMLFPGSRQVISSTIIRYTMLQPRENKEIIFAEESDLNWQLISADGKAVYPKQSLGKPIFINFWATWCPPCIAEMPSIQSFYDKYKGKVDFYLISSEDMQVMLNHMKKKSLNMPVYKLNSRIPQKFYSRKIPTSFLIAPDGQIVMQKSGAADWDGNKVYSLINKMLNEQENEN